MKERFQRNRLRLLALVPAAWLGLFCSALTQAEATGVLLAREGKAAMTIFVVDPGGMLTKVPEAEPKKSLARASIEDLHACLGKLAAAEFKVNAIEAYPGLDSPGIYVGLSKDLKFPGIDGGKQQYGLRTSGSQLLIAGGDERGISHGIYALLHQLGCRWYYPGELWAVMPEPRRILEVSEDRIAGPDFYIQRRVWPGHGLRTETTRRELNDWQRRNCIAQPFDLTTSHSWIGLDPKTDFKIHPEWFARVNGQRQPSKPCYSHPGVVAKVIDYTLNHFQQNPASGMVSVSAPDGLGFCACNLCMKRARVTQLTDIGGVYFGTNPEGQQVSIASETIFSMANQVAKALAASFPKKRVGILAYSAYAHPPSFKLEPNVYVEVTASYRRTPLSMQEQMTLFGQRASALGVREYFDVEQWSWDQPGKAKAAQLDQVQSVIRFYGDNSVRSLNGESSNNFGPNGIGYYAITRLLWDSTLDTRRIEGEFYANAFGPAAEPVQRLYRRWESGPKQDPAALAQCYADLTEAAKLTEGRPVYRNRVDRLRMYAHFLKLWIQPPGNYDPKCNAAATWAKRHDTPEQRRKIEELGVWTSRLIDTHMVHHVFNRYLLSGAEAMGMDTSGWKRAGTVPTAQEVEAVFQKDLADIAIRR